MTTTGDERPEHDDRDEFDEFVHEYTIAEARQQRALLAFLRSNGSVKAACAAAGVKYGSWYRWRRTNPAFEHAYRRALVALSDEANVIAEAERPGAVAIDGATLAALLTRPFTGAEIRVVLAILAQTHRVGVGVRMYASELARLAGLRVSGGFRAALSELELTGVIEVERHVDGSRSVFAVRHVTEWATAAGANTVAAPRSA